MGYENSLLPRVSILAEELSGAVETKRYQLSLENNSQIEISFPNRTKLSTLLPSNVRIIHSPDAASPESRTYYDRNKVISRIDVALNYEWLQIIGVPGLAVLSHEIGHALSSHQTDEELNKLKILYFVDKRLPRKAPNTIRDVLLATQYSMRELGIHLDNELQAWDYGKPYKDLFDISDEMYEGLENRSISAYAHSWTLHTRKGLEKYLLPFGTLDSLKHKLDGKVDVYDISTRFYVKKTFLEFVSYLNTFTDEEAERLNYLASKELSATG